MTPTQPIRVHIEPPDIRSEFGGIMESCTFCHTPTRHWDASKHFPVCPNCAKWHEESELSKS